jgi:hypothetical protein
MKYIIYRIYRIEELKYKDIKKIKKRQRKILTETFQIFIKSFPIRNLTRFSDLHYRLNSNRPIDYWPSTGTIMDISTKQKSKMSITKFIKLTKKNT